VTDEPRNPTLEAAIVAAPDDPAGYTVLADWLEERGHLRATLIRLQLAEASINPPGSMVKATLGKNRNLLVGPALAKAELTWRNGFVHTARIRADAAVITAAFTHPSMRLLQKLGVVTDAPTSDAVIDALASASAPATLHTLSLRLQHTSTVDLRRLASVLSPLQTLVLDGAWPYDHLTAPGVEVATFWTSYTENLVAIARAPWPRLRSLDINVRAATVATEALDPLFTRSDLPAVTSLWLRGFRTGLPLARSLAAAPFARQLETLSLEAPIDDEGAGILAASGALTNLKSLRLDEHELTRDGWKKLGDLFPGVKISASAPARREGDDDDDDDDERYDEADE
jgi:uncharacterized protein (TIGR02996 family)